MDQRACRTQIAVPMRFASSISSASYINGFDSASLAAIFLFRPRRRRAIAIKPNRRRLFGDDISSTISGLTGSLTQMT